MVELVPAKLTHCGPIASRIRTADRIEVEAMGRSPKEALRWGLRVSLHCFTAMVDGRPEAMMGLVSTNLMAGEGLPWFLGTDEVYRHGREMVTIGPKVLKLFAESCPVMENLVWVDNVRAIRMLRKWRFTIGDEREEHGGIDFVRFGVAPAPRAASMAPGVGPPRILSEGG